MGVFSATCGVVGVGKGALKEGAGRSHFIVVLLRVQSDIAVILLSSLIVYVSCQKLLQQI